MKDSERIFISNLNLKFINTDIEKQYVIKKNEKIIKYYKILSYIFLGLSICS